MQKEETGGTEHSEADLQIRPRHIDPSPRRPVCIPVSRSDDANINSAGCGDSTPADSSATGSFP